MTPQQPSKLSPQDLEKRAALDWLRAIASRQDAPPQARIAVHAWVEAALAARDLKRQAAGTGPKIAPEIEALLRRAVEQIAQWHQFYAEHHAGEAGSVGAAAPAGDDKLLRDIAFVLADSRSGSGRSTH